MALLSNRLARYKGFETAPPALPAVNKTVFLVHGLGHTTSEVKSALMERGYRVVFAESAEAALTIWAGLAAPIDLFLADIALGKDAAIEQLVKLLQAENPRMRVLYANDLEQASGPVLAQSYPKQLVAVVDNCLA